jgi:undecaprenyl-diphosphatase
MAGLRRLFDGVNVPGTARCGYAKGAKCGKRGVKRRAAGVRSGLEPSPGRPAGPFGGRGAAIIRDFQGEHVDVVLLVKAAIMGIVEGLTEFLPVSSTGHLILAGSLLGFDDDKAKVFDIAIQTGAILAVIIVYWQKIRETLVALPTQQRARRFALNVIVGFLPAGVIGLLAYKTIKAHLFNPGVVASAFIVGALVILWVERRKDAERVVRVQSVDDMSVMDALKVGFVQCLGMIPGTSRSGATIIGGMLLGLSRKAATEFSFFLAMPTLVGAAVYSLYKERALLSAADLPLFIVGLVFSFISAWLCVRWLLRYISTHSFVPFAWYRIAFGIVVLATAWSGLVNWRG